jgi:thiamine-phosphate pyrophosphorylase
MSRPLLYYITDRTQFPRGENERRQKLLAKISEAAFCGVDFIQLREKDLSSRELESLARQAIDEVRSQKSATRLLINTRSDIALAVGADGVHLPSDDISVRDARSLAALASGNQKPETRTWLVAASCHSEDEVRAAASAAADLVVFAPVFEKAGGTPAGIDALRRACQYKVPVLALGGVTVANAPSCLEAGAAGIAGIRLFQANDISDVLHRISQNSRD